MSKPKKADATNNWMEVNTSSLGDLLDELELVKDAPAKVGRRPSILMGTPLTIAPPFYEEFMKPALLTIEDRERIARRVLDGNPYSWPLSIDWLHDDFAGEEFMGVPAFMLREAVTPNEVEFFLNFYREHYPLATHGVDFKDSPFILVSQLLNRLSPIEVTPERPVLIELNPGQAIACAREPTLGVMQLINLALSALERIRADRKRASETPSQLDQHEQFGTW